MDAAPQSSRFGVSSIRRADWVLGGTLQSAHGDFERLKAGGVRESYLSAQMWIVLGVQCGRVVWARSDNAVEELSVAYCVLRVCERD